MNEETLRKQRACAGEKKPSMQHLKQSCNRHCRELMAAQAAGVQHVELLTQQTGQPTH